MDRNKEHLKQQIVVQKYFKENEPRFLTLAERELIHKLHDSNPEEWTVQQLSKSFPVLPEGIQRILKSKWSPKSIEKVARYDNVVIENWKKFRAGKLPVSPAYKEHLMKFKDRKIILTDRELLAKQYIMPKPKFNKPNSQLFSNIINGYLKEEHNSKLLQEDNSNQKSNFLDENNTVLIADNKTNNDNHVSNKNKLVPNNGGQFISSSRTNSKDYNIIACDKKKGIEPRLTFNEFIKQKLETIYKTSPEEGITLLNVYKTKIDAEQKAQTISDNSINNVKNDTTLQTVQKCNQDISDSSASRNEKNNSHIVTTDDQTETRIKAWTKKIDTENSYATRIKIAKSVYKPGMTYRINDCYYDYDGEFLYRVPGVQN